MFYVYILSSKSQPTQHYTGLTSDLRERLNQHNAGGYSHTAKSRPWQIGTAIFSPETKGGSIRKIPKERLRPGIHPSTFLKRPRPEFPDKIPKMLNPMAGATASHSKGQI